MIASLLFHFAVLLTGLALALAAHHAGRLFGLAAEGPLPRTDTGAGASRAFLLWLLAGPVTLLALARRELSPGRSLARQLGSLLLGLVWAFCLGIVALETSARLIF